MVIDLAIYYILVFAITIVMLVLMVTVLCAYHGDLGIHYVSTDYHHGDLHIHVIDIPWLPL